MEKEYDFKGGRRGAVIPLINQTLRLFVESRGRAIEESVRRVVREEFSRYAIKGTQGARR